MKQWQGVALVAGLALAGCASGAAEPAQAPEPEPGQPAPPPTLDLLPKGTLIEVVLQDTLSSENTQVGARFTASVRTAVTTETGLPVVPEGSIVTGLVTGVDDTDHDDDPAYIRLNFIRLTIEEANHPFAAEIVSTSVGTASSNVEDADKSAAAGAVAGAVLGAVIAGDLKAALEGAALGAGAGSIVALGTDADAALLPRGTILRLRTTANIGLQH